MSSASDNYTVLTSLHYHLPFHFPTALSLLFPRLQ